MRAKVRVAPVVNEEWVRVGEDGLENACGTVAALSAHTAPHRTALQPHSAPITPHRATLRVIDRTPPATLHPATQVCHRLQWKG